MDTTYLDTIQATNLLTLEEYIYVYPRLMFEYTKLGADCNEMFFIEEQIEQHFIHIDFAKTVKNRILDDRDYKKYGTFEDWAKTVRSFDIRIVSLKAIIKFLKTKKSELEAPQPPTPPEDEQGDVIEDDKGIEENNYLLSTIKDFLEPIFELMSEIDYTILVNSLKTYFDTGAFPILTKKITITGRPNKKAIGWILNRIFESQGKGVELPLLHFSKNNISLFKDVDFDETNYLRSNLYNYFATKTKYQSKKT